jgi:hypothetical protein
MNSVGPISVAGSSLSPLPEYQVTPVMKRTAEHWWNLTLRVTNGSAVQTVFVMNQIRQIKFVEGKRLLILLFSDHELEQRQDDRFHIFPPTLTEVAPNEAAEISAVIASPVVFSDMTSNGKRKATEGWFTNSRMRVCDAPIIFCSYVTRSASGRGWKLPIPPSHLTICNRSSKTETLFPRLISTSMVIVIRSGSLRPQFHER